ncbi:MAG TPA: class I SAM-dependent methyltransferase [Candidatus Lustribacter sp.]|nr:class I SAM-dependent methyltransferase [Candidatus Lustribacter sp.]
MAEAQYKSNMGEAQYKSIIADFERQGPLELGPMAGQGWRIDPRRLLFMLARYKFVAKMLTGKKSAIEFGCGDGFATRLVRQVVPSVHGIDFDPAFIAWAQRQSEREGLDITFALSDFINDVPPGKFDASYSLDVIEHVPEAIEHHYVDHLADVLNPGGVCIVGSPNTTATPYASPVSLEGHINLKSAETMRATMSRRFENVFIFSMNDEVVHTGFSPMAHYLFALCSGTR